MLVYVHTVSFSLAFYIVLRPQGIRKQMKTLRKRVHIALFLKTRLDRSQWCPNPHEKEAISLASVLHLRVNQSYLFQPMT